MSSWQWIIQMAVINNLKIHTGNSKVVSFRRMKSLTNYSKVDGTVSYIRSMEICFCCGWGKEDRCTVLLPVSCYLWSVDDRPFFPFVSWLVHTNVLLHFCFNLGFFRLLFLKHAHVWRPHQLLPPVLVFAFVLTYYALYFQWGAHNLVNVLHALHTDRCYCILKH